MTTNTTLRCGHFRKSGAGAILEVWSVFPADHRVTGLPLDLKFTLVHRCEKLTVVQDYRGINRWYVVKDENIIQK